MKALIVDDEEKARDVLRLLIQYHIPEITELKMASGGESASLELENFDPDVVFLDIKMPGQTGFEWLKGLSNRNFDVIFTTAYDQYAILAIRFAAFDYLLKPIDVEDLRETIDRYLSRNVDQGAAFSNLFYNTDQASPRDYRLTIATTEATHYLDPQQIVRCEADGNYTHFYMDTGNRIIASRPLGHYAGMLSEHDFVRCHKSHLVNLSYIASLSKTNLTLKNGTVVDISRRRMASVREALE